MGTFVDKNKESNIQDNNASKKNETLMPNNENEHSLDKVQNNKGNANKLTRVIALVCLILKTSIMYGVKCLIKFHVYAIKLFFKFVILKMLKFQIVSFIITNIVKISVITLPITGGVVYASSNSLKNYLLNFGHFLITTKIGFAILFCLTIFVCVVPSKILKKYSAKLRNANKTKKAFFIDLVNENYVLVLMIILTTVISECVSDEYANAYRAKMVNFLAPKIKVIENFVQKIYYYFVHKCLGR